MWPPGTDTQVRSGLMPKYLLSGLLRCSVCGAHYVMANARVRVLGGVQDGYDSDRKGHKMQAGLSGIIGEAFREMIADRTYAALESRAIQRANTGGRAYGYAVQNGRHVVKHIEADVVLQIFRWYADGKSARWIASELNRRGTPSPGASWARTERRRGGWHPSAISGAPARGIGILCNELYIGHDVWNRTRWTKNPDTGARRPVLRPRSEWIEHEFPELRIVPQELWDRAKARQAQRSVEIGDVIRRKTKKGVGRAPRYPLSGILKCATYGANYVMASATSYACSGFVNGRMCENGVFVRRDRLEDELFSSIRRQLFSPINIEKFKKRIVAGLRQPDPGAARRSKLDAEIQNLTDLVAQGIRSRAVVERLLAAEAERLGLEGDSKVIDLEAAMAALPRAMALYRDKVENLGVTLREDPDRARQALKDTCTIRIQPDNGGAIAEIGINEALATTLMGGSKIGVVAGARFLQADRFTSPAPAGLKPATFPDLSHAPQTKRPQGDRYQRRRSRYV